MLWGCNKQGLLLSVFVVGMSVLGISWQPSQAAENLVIPVEAIQKATRFATWRGIEPDKWATLWLIKRHISPDAYILLVNPNSQLPSDTYPFGVPGAPIRRANRTSMYQRLQQAMNLVTPELNYIASIIHDVEVNIWDAPSHKHSAWFELLYRQLQARYQRDQVPIDCYLSFFDGVARLANQQLVTIKEYSDQLGLKVQCPGINENPDQLVESLDHIDVLREISLGKRVVFIDTREDEEYDEVHLPGATILRLRDVNTQNIQAFTGADLVLPYCVKDFRGFEVAKAMKKLGVPRVATLSPNGLKGWLKAQLPVAQPNKMNDQQAYEALMRCAMEPSLCMKEPS